jgi:hypothetical protein
MTTHTSQRGRGSEREFVSHPTLSRPIDPTDCNGGELEGHRTEDSAYRPIQTRSC